MGETWLAEPDVEERMAEGRERLLAESEDIPVFTCRVCEEVAAASAGTGPADAE
jgi:hypothetical protein